MKKFIPVLAVSLLVVLYSCNSKEIKVESMEGSDACLELSPPPPIMESTVQYTPPVVTDEGVAEDYMEKGLVAPVNKKKIIKDGSLSIRSKDIYSSKKSIDNIIKRLDAYCETDEFVNSEIQTSYDLKIRIPSQNFEKFIASIESGKDEITHKSIEARDVTEEYIDTETRLNNKKEYLKKYKELLSKAKTIKDILDIQENIRILQEEIESKEGRLKYLKDQIAFSTLNITLFKDKAFVYKPQEEAKFSERVKNSLNNGWTSVVDFVLGTITIWPYLVVIIVAMLFAKRVIRKIKEKKK